MRATKRSSRAHRILLTILSASIGLTAFGSAAPNDTVKGSFTVGGKAYSLGHVYARRQPGTQGQTVIVVLLTDNEVPKSVLDDKFRLELTDLARAGKIHGVSVILGADGKPSGTGFTYTKEFEGAVVNQAEHNKSQVKVLDAQIDGTLSGSGTFGSDKWEYSATFQATLTTMQ
jgi:hypothetical protein